MSGPATHASESAVSTSYTISLPSAGPTANGQVLAVKDISASPANYQQLEWVAQSGGGGSGDIEGVLAGTGLSGGATSGTATLSINYGYGGTWTAAKPSVLPA